MYTYTHAYIYIYICKHIHILIWICVQALAMLDRRSRAADSVIEAVKRIETDMRSQWEAAQVCVCVCVRACVCVCARA
jgi:hypothetical protein